MNVTRNISIVFQLITLHPFMVFHSFVIIYNSYRNLICGTAYQNGFLLILVTGLQISYVLSSLILMINIRSNSLNGVVMT